MKWFFSRIIGPVDFVTFLLCGLVLYWLGMLDWLAHWESFVDVVCIYLLWALMIGTVIFIGKQMGLSSRGPDMDRHDLGG